MSPLTLFTFRTMSLGRKPADTASDLAGSPNPSRWVKAASVILCALCLLASSLLAAPAEYIVRETASVKAGGATVQLAAGQTVTVLGVSNGQAVLRVAMPNGSVGIAQVPISLLAPKPVSPATLASTPNPAPRATPSAPTSPLPGTPAVPAGTGWKTTKLDALPAPPKKPLWFPYGFAPADEDFELYLPKTCGLPAQPCGVLAWTNPIDNPGTPRKFEPLLDEFRLIAISAAKCGNEQQSERRVGLLTSAMLELSKTIAIDKKRCVLSGLSGGGRVSALGCFAQPDLWRGAISWCGGNFYKDHPLSNKPGMVHYGINHEHPQAVTPANVAEARGNVKFVLITGLNDFNLIDSRDIEGALKKDGFRVLLIEEPGLGHTVGSIESMRQALEFALGPPPK